MNEGIMLSILGGVGIQLFSLIELHKTPKKQRPDFKDIFYYLPWIINPFFSWLIGYAYFSGLQDVNKLLAIHIGASAPLIFNTLTASSPKEVLTKIE
ncbi:hypothetical protein [Pedobacter gandavensis]|uniref:hypothetical protein n=1 Tax=Pedobacter gandavensis TaxID=2679963 RepID=UPI00292FEB04|nr:hypothetical protein [Pedobacter gandavensis]